MKPEECNCEGFYKTEFFLALDTIQKLREELDERLTSFKPNNNPQKAREGNLSVRTGSQSEDSSVDNIQRRSEFAPQASEVQK